MKRFGFIWNEIIQSWRDEDIICHAEQEKLEFNELPRVLLEANSLADLVGPYDTSKFANTVVFPCSKQSSKMMLNKHCN